jgi:hypothetical protein
MAEPGSIFASYSAEVGLMGSRPLHESLDHRKARALCDLCEKVTQAGAPKTQDALTAAFFEAHVREVRIVTTDVLDGAEQRCSAQAISELRNCVLKESLPIISLVSTGSVSEHSSVVSKEHVQIGSNPRRGCIVISLLSAALSAV